MYNKTGENMNKYIELIAILELKSIFNENQSKEWDFDFITDEEDTVLLEAKKLIYHFDKATYIKSDGIRFYFINDGLLYYSNKKLAYISKLMKALAKYSFYDEVNAISYYIYSLHYSYNKGKKYLENPENKKYKKIFNSYFEENEFYNQGRIIKSAINFSQDLIEYATMSQDKIYNLGDLLIDCCRVCFKNNCYNFQSKLSVLIGYRTYHNREFIIFDENIKTNFLSYFELEIKRIQDDLSNEVSVIRKLYSLELIKQEHEDIILYAFEQRFMRIINEQDNFSSLFDLEKLEEDIIRVRNIAASSKEFVLNIKKLLYKVQKEKRDVAKSVDYQKMDDFEFKADIPSEYIDKAFNLIEKDILLAIYKQCMIDFEYFIEDYLDSTFKYVFSQFATKLSIYNESEGQYRIDYKPADNNIFKKYYDEKINEVYLKNENSYTNKVLYDGESAYEKFIEYILDIYQIQIGIPRSLLVEKYPDKVEEIVFTKLSGLPHNFNNNYQIMLLSMIIQIEHAITELFNYFEKKKQVSFKEEYLGIVFDNLIEKNKKFLNGFMYINFALYEKNGLRIRDKLAHGNYPSLDRDLTVFLLVVTSLLHASYTFNSIIGSENDE